MSGQKSLEELIRVPILPSKGLNADRPPSDPVIDDGRFFYRCNTGWRLFCVGLVLSFVNPRGRGWSLTLYRPTKKGQP